VKREPDMDEQRDSPSGDGRRHANALFESGKWLCDFEDSELEWGPDEYGQSAKVTHWMREPKPPGGDVMLSLILRATQHPNRYSLSNRRHESVGEIEYRTLCYVSRATADEIIRAGSLRWLFGEPEDVP